MVWCNTAGTTAGSGLGLTTTILENEDPDEDGVDDDDDDEEEEEEGGKRRRRMRGDRLRFLVLDRVRGSRTLMCKPSHQQFFELCLWMNCDAASTRHALGSPVNARTNVGYRHRALTSHLKGGNAE